MMLSEVYLSVAFIGPKSRTARPRPTKIDTEVADVKRDKDTTFKVKRSKVELHGTYCGGLSRSLLLKTTCVRSRTLCPAPVHRTLWPRSSPYTPYACGAKRALLPVAVGTMNIHAVCDRRQTSDSIIALSPRLLGAGT